MSRMEAIQAIESGIGIVEHLIDNGGLDILVTGEMGIGNTTPSAAILSVVLGRSPIEVTGRGTGIDDVRFEQKIKVIELAITLNQPNASDPLEILSKVGGFEIGGIAGLILGGSGTPYPHYCRWIYFNSGRPYRRWAGPRCNLIYDWRSSICGARASSHASTSGAYPCHRSWFAVGGRYRGRSSPAYRRSSCTYP